mmetsp:Transcript_12143/g.35523  ORF Transcript_12143/g.35523 Transcript_12143/m.35523 type:complete len:92 (+) Transcript_12143:1930-2205(+)
MGTKQSREMAVSNLKMTLLVCLAVTKCVPFGFAENLKCMLRYRKATSITCSTNALASSLSSKQSLLHPMLATQRKSYGCEGAQYVDGLLCK